MEDYDVIVIGTRFSGISALYRLRKEGLKALIFESAPDFGGVWYWNSFSRCLSDHIELREYFVHIDKTLDLRKDVSFNSKANSCTWNKDASQWTITTESGAKAKAQFIVVTTGLLHKPHPPSWEAQATFKGGIYHSASWPSSSDLTGKKVAITGAGATAVQIGQEVGRQASHLVRRPSYCLPMGQRRWIVDEQTAWKSFYPALFASGRATLAGFPTQRREQRVQDASAAEREAFFERIWASGAFHFTMLNFNNVTTGPKTKRIVYDFWRCKVGPRLTHPAKQMLRAPERAPYIFGTKKTLLEHGYYDVLNRANVEVVDLSRDGVRTYLGIMMNGFPNAFIVYSPQALTALSNGPTIIERQCDLVIQAITSLHKEGKASIEPTQQAESEWKSKMNTMVEGRLFPYTNSWWNTSNIPGKRVENQTYILGIAAYEECREKLERWQGFEVAAA
ncbi:FAD/NAD(P)-binding domain-containing protein [Didymella exigua CBS 183.55]|uniref:FAD/NAD(P)-binding domain-containing protein n=1 Tax=Didymella exigua CBS 183.55 TaxID=1150837 RepID=A0A6A5RT35_9PLEO|nr:FAD/NAD(P)-binding domain-containing protein [Didymella exigua CBS 183.55]KAF1931615.1 FAD/NAD(P)-binding domain-containing protein [Didymella exigua CBS 183.55]